MDTNMTEAQIKEDLAVAKRLLGKELVNEYELVDQIAELNYKLQNMSTKGDNLEKKL